MKKVILSILAMLLPMMAWAYDAQIDGIYYNFDKNAMTAMVTYFDNYSNENAYSGDVTIPSEVTYNDVAYSVSFIGNLAFFRCSALTSVTFPESVTSIGYGAFSGCSCLTSVTIPNSVTSIGIEAFKYCSGLTSVNIPNSVTSITDGAFYGCSSLTSVTIPNSVTSIGSESFKNCSGLTSVTIPNSVTSIGKQAFYNCSGLTSVLIPNSVTTINEWAFFGCSGLTSVTIPNSVMSIGNSAFASCKGLNEVIALSETPPTISENTFSNYDITVKVPLGAKAAYLAADYWNKFNNIVESSDDDNKNKRTIHVAKAGTLSKYISESEKYTIEELTLTGELNGTDFLLLRDMAGGVGVYIPGEGDSHTDGKLKVLDLSDAKIVSGGDAYYIVIERAKYPDEKDAYYYNYLTDSNIIPYDLFCDCRQIASITLPKSLTCIGGFAFSGCSGLTSITIPNSVTIIGDCAFQGCSCLTSITIPNSVTNIGQYAFGNTGWYKSQKDGILYLDEWLIGIKGDKPTGDIIIVEGTRGIAGHAFDWCTGITSITIPNSVTSIGYCAFQGCSAFTSITIPNSVTSIGASAFEKCDGLKEILLFPETPPTITENTFSNYDITVKVPLGAKAAYQSADYWNKFKTIEEVDIVTDEELEKIINEILINFSLLDDPVARLEETERNMVNNKVYVPEHSIVLEIILDQFHKINNTNASYFYDYYKKAYEELYKLKGEFLTKEQIEKYGEKLINEIEFPYYVNELCTLPKYLQTGTFTCNDGGCIKIGNEIEVRNETKTLSSFHSSISNCQFKLIEFIIEYIPFTITIEPDEGYRIKSLKIGDRDTTATSFDSDFAGETFIVEFEPTGDAKKVEKPTISFENGKLKFACATEDVTYKYTISGPSAIGEGNAISLSPVITITVVATRSGYEDSAPAELQLPYSIGKLGDLNADGMVNAADAVKLVDIIMSQE